MRLLLAEDEVELSRALAEILRHSQYTVDVVLDGQETLERASSQVYDGIILDIMMPKMDGIQVLTELRRSGDTTPVLLLTAKTQVDDRILGLDSGADDYLGKPFVMGELLARVRSMTRRTSDYVPDTLEVGNIVLDRNNYELRGESSSVRLSNKEFRMMELLARCENRFLAKEYLLEQIWGGESGVNGDVVWVYISYLRRKLEALNAEVEIVESREKGYALERKSDD